MSLQYRLHTGEQKRQRFIAFENAYHGDTLGAASLGGVNRFFSRFRTLGFEVDHLSSVADLDKVDPSSVTAVVIEPLIQGVNEMCPWPQGMLRHLREWASRHGIHLILDEVMTGFGRTGTLFACQNQHEKVIPDFICLAKGLTGGTVPLAATITTDLVYRAFLGPVENAFYYGHSYTANPIGCAAALASLKLFETDQTLEQLPKKIAHLQACLKRLQSTCPQIHEVRQCGLIAGIELRQADGKRFPPNERAGENFALALRSHGLITRNILDTIVFMPPLSITLEEIEFAIEAFNLTEKMKIARNF